MEKADKRDITYLEETMFQLWDNHFSDVPRKNLVLIHFGKYSSRRLGSIKWADRNTRIKSLLRKKKDFLKIDDDERITVITVTKYFEDKYIPDHVVDLTIAHEMVHYAHGFHSPLPKLYSLPHQGGVVKKELQKRGLGDMLKRSDEWLKDNWYEYIKSKRRKLSKG